QGSLKPSDLASADGWRNVRVGLSWNAQFEDLRDYMGVGWYRVRFDLPQLNNSRRALIRFGAVDYFAEVTLNGKSVGTHEGGYTPFTFDVTEAAKQGSNELVVRVIDPPMDEKDNRAHFPEMMYNEIPHGKQNWYVQTGGIWQPVWLDVKPALYIKEVHVVATTDGSLNVVVQTNQALNPPPGVPRGASSFVSGGRQNITELKVRAIDPSGKAFDLRPVGGGAEGSRFQTRIPDPLLWRLNQPNLYTIEAKVGEDSFSDRFGFRSFESRDGKLYLNGEPYYMIAALDQDFYPDTIYTPPSEEYVRDMMLKGKRLGLNMLRCHIKVPDPVYLKVADEVGMLVWYEVPSWNDFNHFTPKAAERGEKILREMVARDWNHPSIVIQSVINEGWGTDLKQADQRKWLKEAYERAKRLTAPLGRLIVDNSACCNNFHVKTDIEDNHRYNSIPDYHADFDRWVADFATHPKWNFSPHGDAERTGREPLILSEFGNWGLPRLPDQLPWWFGRDFAGREVTRPAGVLDRFKQFNFGGLFKDFNSLAEETQWHQFISLKHEIEEIRRHGPIQGYVITEFTDINWEVNGLMDMWRNPKVYAAELAKIQQPDVVLARLPKHSFTSGERVEVQTLISHYGAKDLSGARVKWSTDMGASGEFLINDSIERASVTPLKSVTFIIPETQNQKRARLTIDVRARDGSLVAENHYDFFVFPKAKPSASAEIILHDAKGDNAQLARSLAAAGYKVSTSDAANAKALMISPSLDDMVKRHLESGGRAIILVDSKEALPANGAIKVAAREGSDLDGNWVTNFNWARTAAPPFDAVAFSKVMGFESARVIPRYVIQGVRGEDYSDVMSGIFYGWLNNNAALAVQMQAGTGKLLATTFRFADYGSDPYATHLLDAMINHVSGPGFSPKLRMQ
ncbi:MAG TPA: hypothetical protein VJZ26_17605, partial [Blastocatellia bacterium]|nr:hypothetical protein [Blastocatellia bacterium]